MKRTLSVLLLAACVMALFAGSASALQWDNKYAGIALHVVPFMPPAPMGGCGLLTGLTNATMNVAEPTLTVPGVGPYYFAYVLVCNASDSTGIAGMELGIDYAGGVNEEGGFYPICVYNWTACGDLQFPYTGWPGPGGSNLITWDADHHCQNTPSEELVKYSVIAVGGYFYMGVYGPAQMFIIPRPVSGYAKVADCEAREDVISNYVPSHLGVAGWGGLPGYNPCGAPTPVNKTTWGGVKSLLSH